MDQYNTVEGKGKDQRWKERDGKLLIKCAADFKSQVGIIGQFLKLFTWLIIFCYKALLP